MKATAKRMTVERLCEGMLRKFTGQAAMEIRDKKICCIGYSAAYLEELDETYGLMSAVDRIVDTNARNIGIHNICGRKIEVCGTGYLDSVDLQGMAILITSDYHMEEYERLMSVPHIRDPADVIYYFASRETEYELGYREKYRDAPLEDIIIFRSGPHASAYVEGMDFSDNARALFEYMLGNGYNEKYRLVWLVKNPGGFEKYRDASNVEFMSFDWSVSENKEDRDRYYNALCLAKYIFFTDAYGFARNCRSDQTRVQLWHGCGFKTRVNFVRCERRYEYTTVISDLYSKIHQDIYGLREDQVLVTGYAKQDWLFHPAGGWQERLGVPRAARYIFWLPTFRTAKGQLCILNERGADSQTGLPVVDTHGMMSELDALLKGLDTVLVLKLHPFQNLDMIDVTNSDNIVILDNARLVREDIQINQLLGNADALVSDYSSAAVDYMLLDRPMAFTLDDVAEYEQSRGFVFENIREWLPGMEVFSFDDFCRFVREVGNDIDSTMEKRGMLAARMHRYHDDCSCRRIAGALGISTCQHARRG